MEASPQKLQLEFCFNQVNCFVQQWCQVVFAPTGELFLVIFGPWSGWGLFRADFPAGNIQSAPKIKIHKNQSKRRLILGRFKGDENRNAKTTKELSWVVYQWTPHEQSSLFSWLLNEVQCSVTIGHSSPLIRTDACSLPYDRFCVTAGHYSSTIDMWSTQNHIGRVEAASRAWTESLLCDHGSLSQPVATLLSIQNGFVSGQWHLLHLPIDKPTDHHLLHY